MPIMVGKTRIDKIVVKDKDTGVVVANLSNIKVVDHNTHKESIISLKDM